MIQIISGNKFINRLTANQLTASKLNKVLAYLRAKKVLFYDNWSKEHCLILDSLQDNKRIIIEALSKTI
jgi:hypothetical protein